MTSIISTRSKRILLLFIVLVIMLAIVVTVSANDKTDVQSGGDAVGYTAIVGSPLTINVAKDASYQVKHDGVDPTSPGQVYDDNDEEADSGIFLWFDGVAVGPDFSNHEGGTASNNYSDWVGTSQSSVTGSGTSADPWIVETDVENADTGATMTVGTIYVNGDDHFRINWQICLTQTGAASTFLAADYYLEGSDYGYGFYDEESGSVGGYNETQDWYQVFTPITPADFYYEGYYGTVWDLIGYESVPGNGFNNTISSEHIDNGAGLQWNTTIDGCSEFSSFWSFGELPIIPTTTSVSMSELVGSNSGGNMLLFVGILAAAALSFVVIRQRLLKKRA